MDHLSEYRLQRFFEGKATRSENRVIVAHLLRGCDSCAALAVRAYRPAVAEQVYDEVFDRASRWFAAQRHIIRFPVPGKTSACSPW